MRKNLIFLSDSFFVLQIDLVEIKAAYQGFYNISLLDDLRPMFESKQFRLISGIVLDK